MEIELRFNILSLPDDLIIHSVKEIKQSYIYLDKYTTIRKRMIKENNETNYYYTVKCCVDQIGKIGCHEIESTIDASDYFNMPVLTCTREISKTRVITYLDNGLKAEIDMYNGKIDGYITIEVEFDSIEELKKFKKPSWFGNESNISNRDLSLMKNDSINNLIKHNKIKKELEKIIYN